ncbi:MAG: hypothetical protein ACXVNM_13650 [Bacteroidia bacterium]
MRKAEFEVPAEVIGDFTDKLEEVRLDNRILGRNEHDEIEIEVYYEKDETNIIDELEAYLEELIENIDSEEEEEDED